MGDKDSLLAAICHDLRAPLAAVTMGANFVLQTTQRDDASARSVKILEAMLRSCAQMERLIRNFADVSELEAEGIRLRLTTQDAAELLDLTAQSLAEAARARSVSFEVLRPESPIALSCDRERLLRALGQVVENAVRYAPEGSTVTLALTSRDAEVDLAITDRGPGISYEAGEHLFDRRWHARHVNRAGSGCGLAIAKGYVEAHHGSVRVASAPGGPTTFTLGVPRAQP